MNPIKCAMIAGLMIGVTALPAQAAMTVIYQASGVYDSGGPIQTGIATAILCTNPTNRPRRVRVIIRNFDGAVAGSATVAVAARGTATFVTRTTVVFVSDAALATGWIAQGSATIMAASDKVFCSIVVIDASKAIPTFANSLHLVRFPRGGGEE